MPTSLLHAPLVLLNFQTFLRPYNAKLKGLSTRLIGKTKNLLLRKLGQVARQFSRQNKFLYPSFYSQCFLIRRLINNSWLNERWIVNTEYTNFGGKIICKTNIWSYTELLTKTLFYERCKTNIESRLPFKIFSTLPFWFLVPIRKSFKFWEYLVIFYSCNSIKMAKVSKNRQLLGAQTKPE